ncbi:CysS/YqeB C-terminal domain-containing protein [Streptomyces albus]|uniref:CysS/YqeB C-terminal domain-containing protein n=1 Tax=Streptomyces albus TaxID=1888 RepID=UPI003D124145
MRRRRSPRGRVHHLGRQRAWPRRARPCVAAEAAAALADKRTGAAGEALEQLRALGINVRDRGQAQQYRKV